MIFDWNFQELNQNRNKIIIDVKFGRRLFMTFIVIHPNTAFFLITCVNTFNSAPIISTAAAHPPFSCDFNSASCVVYNIVSSLNNIVPYSDLFQLFLSIHFLFFFFWKNAILVPRSLMFCKCRFLYFQFCKCIVLIV